MSNTNRTLLCCLIALLSICRTYAADTTAKKPTVLLVQLHAEKNRLQTAQKIGNTRILEAIRKDAEEVRIRTIMDFSENFTAFPVYYFMDSCIDQVRNKQFAGILFNADGSVAQNVPLDTARPNYMIAYYSWADYRNPTEKEIQENKKVEDIASRSTGKGLVIYDARYNQKDYYYKFEYANTRTLPLEEAKQRPVGARKRYFYKSKQFDIEYYPFAYDFNKNIIRRRTDPRSSFPF